MSDFNATQFVKQRARKTSGVVTGVVTALAVAGVLVLAALVKLQTNTNQGEQGNEQKPGQPAAAAPPAQPAQPVNAADQPVDNDLTLIREFLAANTNTGEWEEVEVFEAVSVSNDQWSVIYRNVIVANEGDAELSAMRDVKRLSRQAFESPSLRFVRMRFRAQNVFGGTQLADMVFMILEDTVSPVPELVGNEMIAIWGSLSPVN